MKKIRNRREVTKKNLNSGGCAATLSGQFGAQVSQLLVIDGSEANPSKQITVVFFFYLLIYQVKNSFLIFKPRVVKRVKNVNPLHAWFTVSSLKNVYEKRKQCCGTGTGTGTVTVGTVTF